jgi:leader peptidase (prepilin peptidase)/N-methyltransferase
MLGSFLLISGILFALGAIVGSFLNVVICRSVSGESWVTGRSHCDDCHKQLYWIDNIPLLSFLMLRGKCRFCHQPISLSNPVIEFLTGTLFVWWYWGGFLFFRLTQQPFHYVQPLFWLTVALILVVVFFADLRYMIIPDEAVIALTGVTIVYRLALVTSRVMQPSDLFSTIIAALVVGIFFLSLWLFTKGRGMGFGDVKLVVPLTLLIGWPNALVWLFLSFCSGATVGVILLLLKKAQFRQAIPFGPYLIVSTFVTLVYGNELLSWYLHFLR